MARLTNEQLRKVLSQNGYGLSNQDLDGRLRHPLPKPDAKLLPLGKDKDEERGTGRFRVRIERRGAKILDADNLGGSVKFILDALRYRNLIPEDNPAAIDLEIHQVQTPKQADRGTLIEIERL